MRDFEPLWRPLSLLFALLVIGTLGYVLLEGFPWFEAAYMTVTTLATVGYGEIRPLSTTGRAFTMLLIIFGVGGALYTLTELVRVVYDGQLGRTLWRRRMERRIDQLRDHFILCGYGRVGRQIAADLRQAGLKLVVIDRDPTGLAQARELSLLVVEGDAGSDEVLRRAGIERARALISAVAEDADNLYVILSARALNPNLLIVARANFEESIAKLERAGANRVVSPYSIGGRRMAMLALRPLSVEFVDALFHGPNSDLLLEEVQVAVGSPLVGHTVDEVQTRLAPGVNILAIRRRETIVPSPDLQLCVEVGDELVVIGAAGWLQSLEKLA